MRVVVTGAAGMLGQDLVEVLSGEHTVIAVDLAGTTDRMDVTDLKEVRRFLGETRPDVVVHCAAFTDVDGCERDPDAAYRVNALGTASVAGACHSAGAAMVYISTDFVFDGTKGSPYTEFDAPRPLGVYGASKLAGEELVRSLCPRHIVVRTQWLYGPRGRNFPFTILKRADEGKGLRVVRDQIGAPTYTWDLAQAIASILEMQLFGTVHVANRGEVSWYGFAARILEMAGMDASVIRPIPASEWPSPTARPAYSVLRPYMLELAGRAGMLRPWEDALADFMRRIGRLRAT